MRKSFEEIEPMIRKVLKQIPHDEMIKIKDPTIHPMIIEAFKEAGWEIKEYQNESRRRQGYLNRIIEVIEVIPLIVKFYLLKWSEVLRDLL